jgi:hypothetical protein
MDNNNHLAGATAQQGGGLRWIKASELTKDISREYIGKWRKKFVNNGSFSKDGSQFMFDNIEYGDIDEIYFDDLYILMPGSEAPASHDEKLRVAVDYLQKIAQMSDPGSMVKAITDMKGLATEAMAKINANG